MQLKTKVAVVCTIALLLSALLVGWNLSAGGDRQIVRAPPVEEKAPARTPRPELDSAPELATDIERLELRVRVVDRLGAPIPAARVGLRPIRRFFAQHRGRGAIRARATHLATLVCRLRRCAAPLNITPEPRS